MKKTIYFLCLMTTCLLFMNCKKDTDDLTKEIVGVYVGGFASNAVGNIDNYEIRVTKVNDSRIMIEPVTGTEFESWETDLERFNSSTITATIGQLDPSVSFTIGDPVAFTLTRSNEGEAFVGEMK